MTAPTPSPEEFARTIPGSTVWFPSTEAKAVEMIRARDASLTAPLRAEVERLTTAANAHESCKESWRECLPPGHDCMFGPDIARHWESRAERAEAENARLRAALQFYADPLSYRSPSTGFALQYDPEPSPIARDRGRAAAKALAPEGGK